MTPDATSGLFDCALAIARSRNETLELLRQAIERTDADEVLRLAKALTGLGSDAARPA
jgi:hypothetical protein